MTPEIAQIRILELREQIESAQEEYYGASGSLLSDSSFDLMLDQLAELERQFPQFITPNSPTQKVGSSTQSLFDKFRHSIPMLSIANVYNEAEAQQWHRGVLKDLKKTECPLYCELKIDGVAISVSYRDGYLQRAVTRGDGEVGDIVTENVAHIIGLPQQIAYLEPFEVRGEIYFSQGNFTALQQQQEQSGEKPFKNPRNAAAGSLRLKDSTEVARRKLSIFLYDIVEGAPRTDHDRNLQFLQEHGFAVNPHGQKAQSLAESMDFCEHWEAHKHELDFEVDGAVLKVNALDDRRQLGSRSKSPRWAVAKKFTTVQAKSRLISVEVSVGRTGNITPVANLAPTNLLNTLVKRASLHNYDQIRRLGIYSGDLLIIEKGGEIIPKVVGIDYTQRLGVSQPLPQEHACPHCSSGLIRYSGEVDLRCPNPQCQAVVLARLEHFVCKKGLDIRSLGPAHVRLLYSEGLLCSIPDIFRLVEKKDALLSLEGFGHKAVNNLFASIEQSKTSPLHKLIFALGIPQIGETAAKLIAAHSKRIQALLSFSPEQISAMPFIPVVRQELSAWLHTPEHRLVLEELLALGVDPVHAENSGKQPFLGKSIVITGVLSVSRGLWSKRLESLGFQVMGAVSAKTDYLLYGEKAGSKLQKATKLGIRLCNEEAMELIIAEQLNAEQMPGE